MSNNNMSGYEAGGNDQTSEQLPSPKAPATSLSGTAGGPTGTSVVLVPEMCADLTKSTICDLPSTAVQSIHIENDQPVEVDDEVFVWRNTTTMTASGRTVDTKTKCAKMAIKMPPMVRNAPPPPPTHAGPKLTRAAMHPIAQRIRTPVVVQQQQPPFVSSKNALGSNRRQAPQAKVAVVAAQPGGAAAAGAVAAGKGGQSPPGGGKTPTKVSAGSKDNLVQARQQNPSKGRQAGAAAPPNRAKPPQAAPKRAK